MTIQELLHELGTRMGTGPLTLDGQTPCTLCFDGKYVVISKNKNPNIIWRIFN